MSECYCCFSTVNRPVLFNSTKEEREPKPTLVKEIEVFSVMGRWIVSLRSIQSALGEERDLSQSIRGWIEQFHPL